MFIIYKKVVKMHKKHLTNWAIYIIMFILIKRMVGDRQNAKIFCKFGADKRR